MQRVRNRIDDELERKEKNRKEGEGKQKGDTTIVGGRAGNNA